MLRNQTIKDVIEAIDSKEILLPAVQRKFVWKEEQIIELFDSVMQGYPFGTLLFWKLKEKNEVRRYKLYQFIKDYSFRDQSKNKNSGVSGKSSLLVVMDGQQRLSSFYIGIKGTIETKDKWKKDRAENWKKRSLYFVPRIPDDEREDDDTQYRFVFLEQDEADRLNAVRSDENKCYAVSQFYDMTNQELRDFFGVGRTRKDWQQTVETLRSRINDEKLITSHIIEEKTLGDVLEIFRRTNNGGTKLSPSDLVFSTIIASWEEGRDKIDDLLEKIGSEGVLKLQESFVIKACLYVLNQPVSMRLESLKAETVEDVKKNWKKISQAIYDAKNFLANNNFRDSIILSYNAVLPIVYYCYYNGIPAGESERELVNYFVVSQLFGLFSGDSSKTLEMVRNRLQDEQGNAKKSFRITQLYGLDLSAGREDAFRVSDSQLEKLLSELSYGDRKTILLLCMLQKGIQYKKDEYDVDHVCSMDECKNLFKGQKRDVKREYSRMKDLFPNLQLLSTQENRGDKQAVSLYEWVVTQKHLLPYNPFSDDPEKLRLKTAEDFEEFFKSRKELMKKEICSQLHLEKGERQ